MKTTLLVGAFLIVGVLVGVSISAWEIRSATNSFGLTSPGKSASSEDDFALAPKLVLLDEATYNFGVMERLTSQGHTFRIRNEGNSPLVFDRESSLSTCKCTDFRFTPPTIPPGETGTIYLEWRPNDFARNFRQRALVVSNDPNLPELELTIEGQVDQVVRPDPLAIQLGRISPSDEKEATFRVYCYRDHPLELQVLPFGEETTADQFAVVLRPLTEDEVQQETNATCGYHGTLRVLPGLPQGVFQQTIRLATNLERNVEVDLPIRGEVAGDISLFGGSEFNSDRRLLDLGVVARRTGREYQLYFVVKGPLRDEVEFEVEEIFPADLLQVELEEAQLTGSRVRRLSLNIAIPPEAPSASHLGTQHAPLGKIRIRTTHPLAPEIQVYVRFAVE